MLLSGLEAKRKYLLYKITFFRLTMKQLVKNLGDQFNLPTNTIDNLNLDKFVDDAIKVEEGEIESLRPPPIQPEDVMLESSVGFADEETEPWTPMKTPEPSPSPEPEPPKEPTPPPSPSPEPPREPTPEPPKEPTPEPSPEPEPEPGLTDDELAAQKRRAYSEEAWRRYQEYQKVIHQVMSMPIFLAMEKVPSNSICQPC